MKGLPTFNPLYYRQEVTDIHHFLSGLASRSQREICFYNDKVGKYFSPLRVHDNVSLCFSDERYYEHYHLLSYDVYLAKSIYQELRNGFAWDLIEHFEERFHTEESSAICSFILLCLHNLSNDVDGNFCDYDENNIPRISEVIDKLDSYFLRNTELYLNTPPEEAFVVSVGVPFSRNEGILLSSRKEEYKLVRTIDDINVYYIEGKKE